MIKLSRKRSLLFAGAAGVYLAVPLGFSAFDGGQSARAEQPTSASPAAVDATQTTARQRQADRYSRYESEVQRQLQSLYRQDGRPMPNMRFPAVSPEAMQQHRAQGARQVSGRRGRWSWLKPSNWRRNWQRIFGGPDQPQQTSQPQQEPVEMPPYDPGAPAPLASERTRTLPPTGAGSSNGSDAAPRATTSTPGEQPRLFPGLLEEMTEQSAGPRDETPMLILTPSETKPSLSEPVAAPGVSEPASDTAAPWTEDASQQPASLAVEADDDDPLSNAFPELSETAADERRSPYSGLNLEDDPFVEPQSAETSRERQPALLIPSGPSAPGEPPGLDPARLADAGTESDSPASSDAEDKMARIRARRGLSGFRGFCPVVLRDYRDLEDAKTEFSVIFEGRPYWFSSEEARQAFLAAPEAYAPVQGGIDIVQWHKTGEEVEGSLEHAAWYRGRLHLFATAENKAAFSADPDGFSSGE